MIRTKNQGVLTLRRTKARILTTLGMRRNAGAALKVFPDDVFIVSYPRSGNMWMRFLMGSMIYNASIDFENIEQYVPDIYRCTHDFLEARPRPRYLKSHEPYDARYPQVIYLVRDPRDVAISYYRWLQKYRRTQQSFDDFLADFAADRTRYAGWGANVQSWYDNAAKVMGGILFVRYEDLLQDTVAQMQAIAGFLSLDVSLVALQKLVYENQFERMQDKEERAQPTHFIKGARADIKFVRQGAAGQWRERLSEAQAAAIAHAFAGVASRFGYELYGQSPACEPIS